jgi:hypothetical protein
MKKYWPLAALILIAILAASFLYYGIGTEKNEWMHFFMGFFLCQFSMLKLFHPSDFADGFQMYDLIAKKSRTYAYLYPFIELGLGLSYLAFISPKTIALITILVFGLGIIGVIKALQKGLDVRCACMGTILDVPLSTVTLTEDIGMVLMAIFILLT